MFVPHIALLERYMVWFCVSPVIVQFCQTVKHVITQTVSYGSSGTKFSYAKCLDDIPTESSLRGGGGAPNPGGD